MHKYSTAVVAPTSTTALNFNHAVTSCTENLKRIYSCQRPDNKHIKFQWKMIVGENLLL